jgi:hypothetical protein
VGAIDFYAARLLYFEGKMITWSYGGGTQSIAIAVLVVQGRLPKPELIGICDTGREASETWEYTEQYVKPLLASLGLVIERIPHDLATVDMYGKNGDMLVPAFTDTGKLPTFCSDKWKKQVFRRWLRTQGVESCVTWIGISLDEIGRLKESDVRWQTYEYPLVFSLPMKRDQCRKLILDAGLPEPPKSSCWMCPHRHNDQWARLKEHYPDDWQAAIELDEAIRERDTEHAMYLHNSRVPLRDADLTTVPQPDLPLFGQVDGCDSGYCFV